MGLNKMIPKTFVIILLLAILSSCSDPYADLPEKRVMVLGVDGMDYGMTTRLMAEGRMPNFTRLSQQGGFNSLETSVPPLSPVAWSDFMTGLDSGGHGIFDFLHRDPDKLVPEFSMSKTIPPEDYITLGSWKIPTDGGQLINLRKGRVFWQQLQDNGVVSTIIRMPANFPPVGVGERELSGMGTPDIHGGYGDFTFITDKFGAGRKTVEGGTIQEVWQEKGVINTQLLGPLNPYKKEDVKDVLNVPLIIKPLANNMGININLDGTEFNLKKASWSEWIPVEFTMMPVFADLHGMVRFYLKSTSPSLELYVSPINFDPLNADTLLSVPSGFVAELAEETGRFYTQGMPEDTKALEAGIFNQHEFFAQAEISAKDVMAQMDFVVKDFLQERRSFLFYYLGHLDQVSHMTWKSTDTEHPFYDPETDPYWASKIEELYIDIDTRVGQLLNQIGDKATLIVMSDHGFAPWRREFDLNAWLQSEGYLVLKGNSQSSDELFLQVDWNKTKAYGVGFNGLYLNLKGREKHGVVETSQKNALMSELNRKLLSVKDPGSDQFAITKVYQSDQYYDLSIELNRVPDLVIGYAYGTRGSSQSALGAVGPKAQVFKDHKEHWSGDHSMDHESVPGILLTSQPLKLPAESLRDISTSILKEFNLGSMTQ